MWLAAKTLTYKHQLPFNFDKTGGKKKLEDKRQNTNSWLYIYFLTFLKLKKKNVSELLCAFENCLCNKKKIISNNLNFESCMSM